MDAPVASLAQSLLRAADTPHNHPRPQIDGQSIDVEVGSAIQAAQLELRFARGERVVGVKLGLTTADQRDAAGHYRPSVGFLTDTMVLGKDLSAAMAIAPRVEPEIVAVISRTLEPPTVSAQDIIDAVGSVRVGIEVVDPRYPDSGFILPDALADNSSSRAVAWSSEGVAPEAVDLAAETLSLSINGAPPVVGSGSLVMGNPMVVVVEAIEDLLASGMTIPEGFVVFTGNLAGVALDVAPGDQVRVDSDSLGSLTLDVVA